MSETNSYKSDFSFKPLHQPADIGYSQQIQMQDNLMMNQTNIQNHQGLNQTNIISNSENSNLQDQFTNPANYNIFNQISYQKAEAKYGPEFGDENMEEIIPKNNEAFEIFKPEDNQQNEEQGEPKESTFEKNNGNENNMALLNKDSGIAQNNISGLNIGNKNMLNINQGKPKDIGSAIGNVVILQKGNGNSQNNYGGQKNNNGIDKNIISYANKNLENMPNIFNVHNQENFNAKNDISSIPNNNNLINLSTDIQNNYPNVQNNVNIGQNDNDNNNNGHNNNGNSQNSSGFLCAFDSTIINELIKSNNNMNSSIENMNKSMDNLAISMENSMKTLATSMNNSMNNLATSMNNSMNNLATSMNKSMNNLTTSINNSQEVMAQAVNQMKDSNSALKQLLEILAGKNITIGNNDNNGNNK